MSIDLFDGSRDKFLTVFSKYIPDRRRSSSNDNIVGWKLENGLSGHNERRVLVIFTGGTIGMVKNSDGVLAPNKDAFKSLVRSFPQLHDPGYIERRKVLNPYLYDDCYVLPTSKDTMSRIVYRIYEYKELLDSSNMTVENWIRIAKDIEAFYLDYDGFVVLHGTDTLSYTASALSFMLEDIGKCVVITGSQIPMFEPRSDGADNFVSSLIIAGTLNIPEVTVFFSSKLFRGNRTRKISTNCFNAFNSPNFPPLVTVGIDMELNKRAIFRPNKIEKCHVHAKMSNNVGVLRIFPSISAAVLKTYFQPPIEGVVLETFGAGNIPSNREDLIEEIRRALARGVLIVNITQCVEGSVNEPLYETGMILTKAGVVHGFDMTTEAALAKLAYVLTKDEWDRDKKIEILKINIRGELTDPHSVKIDDQSIVEAISNILRVTSTRELHAISANVFGALMKYAISIGDIDKLEKIQNMGADVNEQNNEGKTALHDAILHGNSKVVEYLLLKGANVHAKSIFGESPLITAIETDNEALVKLLIQGGAHLTPSDRNIVDEMVLMAARKGKLLRLHCLKIAGADLNVCDEVQHTTLHKAVISQNMAVVNFLVKKGANRDVKDFMGLTPLDYAVKLHDEGIIRILKEF